MTKTEEDKLLKKLYKEVNKYNLPALADALDQPYVTLYKFATGRVKKPRKALRQALTDYFEE